MSAMPALQLQGVHHVAVIASDYARSKHFYVEVLGLRVLAENYRSARDSWKLDLALPDGSQIELFSFPNPPPRPSRPRNTAPRWASSPPASPSSRRGPPMGACWA